jgi:ParB-like chromosome segregation protein Spo0J
MRPELFDKLRANIRDHGHYPSLVVRSLAASEKYGPGSPYYQRAGGPEALQILDGEHRWKVLQDLGVPKVLVENWGDLNDADALRLLTTLNRLRGKDDSNKRATLLSLLRAGADDQTIATYLPESAEDIARQCQRLDQAEPAEIEQVADDFEPLTLMVDSELARIINAAVALRRSQGHLPGRNLDRQDYQTVYSAYEKARALAAICGDWILKEKP